MATRAWLGVADLRRLAGIAFGITSGGLFIAIGFAVLVVERRTCWRAAALTSTSLTMRRSRTWPPCFSEEPGWLCENNSKLA